MKIGTLIRMMLILSLALSPLPGWSADDSGGSPPAAAGPESSGNEASPAAGNSSSGQETTPAPTPENQGSTKDPSTSPREETSPGTETGTETETTESPKIPTAEEEALIAVDGPFTAAAKVMATAITGGPVGVVIKKVLKDTAKDIAKTTFLALPGVREAKEDLPGIGTALVTDAAPKVYEGLKESAPKVQEGVKNSLKEVGTGLSNAPSQIFQGIKDSFSTKGGRPADARNGQ